MLLKIENQLKFSAGNFSRGWHIKC